MLVITIINLFLIVDITSLLNIKCPICDESLPHPLPIKISSLLNEIAMQGINYYCHFL
jgi:hypothetical protein